MRVLILGGHGRMGPAVVEALGPHHELLVTDVVTPITDEHETRQLDASSLDEVVAAAEGMDAIVNLAVLREDRKLAFDVSTRGCYNAMRAALEHGIVRVVNSGPHFTIQGYPYTDFDYDLHPDVPPQTSTGLYPITKGLGQEICRVFTENHPDLHVITLLFFHLRFHDDDRKAEDITPFTTSWRDVGQAFRLALEVDLAALPSRCEAFNIFGDLPHRKFSNEKAKRLLGFAPRDCFEKAWHKKS